MSKFSRDDHSHGMASGHSPGGWVSCTGTPSVCSSGVPFSIAIFIFRAYVSGRSNSTFTGPISIARRILVAGSYKTPDILS